MQTQGLHHVTAICGEPQRNVDFYAGLLGLHLVKITVNFDDPGTYHLYYGDAAGTPGAILTFFPWPGAPRGRHGVGQTTAITFSVPNQHLAFWKARIPGAEPLQARFGQPGIQFQDPDGMTLEIIADDSESDSPAIARFHSVTLAEAGHDGTARLLTASMGLVAAAEEGNRFRYRAPQCSIDILCQPDARRGSMGAGTVHHIAWRTATDAAQRDWRTALSKDGYDVTPILDRQYFHSIYFREPGGVLFEIATDPPGFAIDEPAGQLGKSLKMPPWLEPERPRIESILSKLTIPEPPFAR
jgi:glyoxalase family protein